jgi:DNA-binding beta-propeller fold protein YncE
MRTAAWWPAMVALLLTAAASPSKRREPAYSLRRTIPMPGDEAWDDLSVDAGAHRLFVTRASRVVVLDVESEKVAGEIRDTPGVHGVALAADLGKGFTSNGRNDTVSIFDLRTLAPLGQVAVAEGPDAILYDPFSQRVFAFARKAGAVTAIDAAPGTPIASVPLDGRPVAAASDGKGAILVVVEDKGELLSFDPVALKTVNRWPLAPCEAPAGLAMGKDARRVFVACRNRMMVVVDRATGAVTGKVPVGAGGNTVVYDEERGLAFVSAGDGTLTVVKEAPEGVTTAQIVTTRPGSHSMALDPRSHRIYVAACRFGAPPPPTRERPHPRAPMAPGSFMILVFAK